MRITKLTIRKNRKFALPNFNSVDIAIELEIEPDIQTSGQKMEKIAEEGFNRIDQFIRRRVNKDYPDATGPDLDPDWLKDGKKAKRAKNGNQ